MKYRYRLRIDYRTSRTKYHNKRDLAHALKGQDALVAQAEDGRLSPYWDGASLSIEKTPVDYWRRVGDVIKIVFLQRLSPPVVDGESGVQSENGENPDSEKATT